MRARGVTIKSSTALAALILGLAALPGAGAAAAGTPAPAPAAPTASKPAPELPPAPCGAHAPEILATTAGSVAERIYASEISSAEVQSDQRQIESYRPLLSALESNDRTALKTAVHSLVYSHTHIVRLRISQGSTLLYDEGGPYILAPVTGTLRAHGKTIGHFVFSVQDDLGYVKLETRFIGAPLVLRTEAGQVPIEGLLSPGPASIPDHGPVSYRGATFEAYSFNGLAYPSGRLRVSLLLPLPAGLASKTCEQIKTAELGLIAQRISRRFSFSQSAYAGYIRLVQTVYIRSGSHMLAGSTHAAPSKLPDSGAVSFHGVDYEVASFSAPSSSGQVRVSVLVPH